MPKLKSNVAHFSAPTIVENYIENKDGSITKRGLILVEGEQTDSRKRKHIFTPERIERIVKNTNAAFKNRANIPMFKEHQKNLDNMIGNVVAPFEARIITPQDLTPTAPPDLVGKLGVFCDGLVVKAKDVVEKVKDGLAKELSPGIDIINDCIKEISVVAQPAIQGMAMYSMGGDMYDKKTFTFEDYDKCMEDYEENREEYDELCEKFYKVMTDIIKASDDELQGQDQMELVGQAFDDFNAELQAMFMGELEDEEEDDSMGELPNPYSLKQGSQIESPYSLYAGDNADFAMPNQMGVVQKVAQSYRRGLGTLGRAGKTLFGGVRQSKMPPTARMPQVTLPNGRRIGNNAPLQRDRFSVAGQQVRNYFTRGVKDATGKRVRQVRWGRVGKAGASALGASAAGYGALKIGSNVTGIGKKKEKNYFNFKF